VPPFFEKNTACGSELSALHHYRSWASAVGGNGQLLPLEIWSKKEKFLENEKSAV